MTNNTCPNCRSDEEVDANVTNSADAYYCWNCDEPFNSARWPCPSCETDEDVRRNPLDDPCEYYCYECNLAFDRPEAPFDPADAE